METTEEVLVTGASGYIGQSFCNSAYSRGYKCVPLGRSTSPDYESISDTNIKAVTAFLHLGGISEDSTKITWEEYQTANIALTRRVWHLFMKSAARSFIFMSSVKAVVRKNSGVLQDGNCGEPAGLYGKSKFEAEKYLKKSFDSLTLKQKMKKQLIILRPGMIYGPSMKGNLKRLCHLAQSGLPFPFGAYRNKRSMLSIRNLEAVIFHLLEQNTSGERKTFFVVDDDPISTREVWEVAARIAERKVKIWNISPGLIGRFTSLGDLFQLPFNSVILEKIIGDEEISNMELLRYLAWNNMPFKVENEIELALRGVQKVRS